MSFKYKITNLAIIEFLLISKYGLHITLQLSINVSSYRRFGILYAQHFAKYVTCQKDMHIDTFIRHFSLMKLIQTHWYFLK